MSQSVINSYVVKTRGSLESNCAVKNTNNFFPFPFPSRREVVLVKATLSSREGDAWQGVDKPQSNRVRERGELDFILFGLLALWYFSVLSAVWKRTSRGRHASSRGELGRSGLEL